MPRFPHLKTRRGNSKHLSHGNRLKGALSVKGREGSLYTAWREDSGEASGVSLVLSLPLSEPPNCQS